MFFRDSDVRKRLKSKGFRQLKNEWFECAVEDLKHVVSEIKRCEIFETRGRHKTYKMHPEQEQAVFGEDGIAPLDTKASLNRFKQLADEVNSSTNRETTAKEIAAEGLKVAVDAMVRAIRKVTLEAGIDSKDFALQCFGGAGGQHACMVAQALEISNIIIHPSAGVLSAYGIGSANETTIRRSCIDR